MKHLLTIVVCFLFLSCSEDFIADNPLDPDNPDYVEPSVILISGPTEGEIITTAEATFGWEGNAEDMEFHYRDGSNSWSAWSAATSTTIDYLDEGSHTFFVQGRYVSEDTSGVAEVSFSVDAVTGPALMFYPRRQISTQGSTVPFMILAEEVTNLTAAEITLSFDPSELQVVSVTEGTLFSQNGETIFVSAVDNVQGSVTISTGLWGGSTPSVGGSGGLAVLLVQIIKQGSFLIGFDGSEVLKTPENSNITVNAIVNGLVVVE